MLKYPKPNNKRIPFEYVGNNDCIWKLPKKLRSDFEQSKQCPVCGSTLKKDFTLIPVLQDKKVKVNGMLCPHCDCLYTPDAYFVELIMHDNKFSRGFTLDGEELWNCSFVKERRKREEKIKKRKQELYQSKKNLFWSIPSSEVLIFIRYNDGTMDGIIIVKSKGDENITKNVYHYTTEFGREVLSVAFAEERKHEGFYNGKGYKIIDEPIFKSNDEKSMPQQILATELIIKSGGGYPTEIKNNRYEIVDMLVYAPFTNRYELIRATYSKDNFSCFVDIGIFRRFVKAYGRPKIMPYFESSGSSLYMGALNDESILKGYGYVVNKQDNLSDQYRRDLLAEIIDLEYMTAHRIARFLSWLVTTRSHQPDAQQKWKEDIQFVENYKANPQRFLIAK